MNANRIWNFCIWSHSIALIYHSKQNYKREVFVSEINSNACKNVLHSCLRNLLKKLPYFSGPALGGFRNNHFREIFKQYMQKIAIFKPKAALLGV